MTLSDARILLRRGRVVVDVGLSAAEIADIEARYQFTFPLDYRALLMEGMPISDGFVDWRRATPADIQKKLTWPYEGICFDIEFAQFWLDEWGEQPDNLEAAFAIAANAVQQAPPLIPICGHRYIPGHSAEAGHPIFSVHQTDIIYCGSNLLEFLENELRVDGHYRHQISEPLRYIPFWSMLVELNSGYTYQRL
jgi:hypothetical protein